MIPTGRPMSSNGHGLPTPRLTRSMSFRQCVVAAPNLSLTKTSAQDSSNVFPLLTPSFTFSLWRFVGLTSNGTNSSNERTLHSAANLRTRLNKLSWSKLPRVIITPRDMAPSACKRLKFSRSRSKKGSLLFHSISSAICKNGHSPGTL